MGVEGMQTGVRMGEEGKHIMGVEGLKSVEDECRM